MNQPRSRSSCLLTTLRKELIYFQYSSSGNYNFIIIMHNFIEMVEVQTRFQTGMTSECNFVFWYPDVVVVVVVNYFMAKQLQWGNGVQVKSTKWNTDHQLSQGSVDNKCYSPSMKSLHFWTVSQPVTDIILIVLRITLPSCLTQKALLYETYDGFKNSNISTLKSN